MYDLKKCSRFASADVKSYLDFIANISNKNMTMVKLPETENVLFTKHNAVRFPES